MYKRKSKYSKELLQEIVDKSTSVAQVIKTLNLKCTGGNYQFIKNKIVNYGIDITHFKGRGWAKNLTTQTSEIVKNTTRKISYSEQEILSENSPQTKAYQLRNLMIKNNIQYECINGHNSIWMDKPLTLHIDHINGNRTDNRLENLRFLCPNCHQQTPTWGNKNKK